ncbi:proteasome assembly chaperone 1-like [Uloborus diversus]|uniref:proteasome assembly chaperone 1-like n=1 Tax=Uloborus diversus TaxID=327109 RepID=UPI0024092EFA|nr:proteasome assembly chaperone 1-like [Uloborus diversus]
MASFFGEVSELSSRAVDDEEVDNQPKFAIQLETLDTSKACSNIPCKAGIFAVGDSPSAFVKSYLLPENATAIAKVKCLRTQNDDSSEFYNGIKNSLSSDARSIAAIYLIDADHLFFDISSNTPEELSTILCNMLHNHFCCDLGIILTSVHASAFKSEKAISKLQPRFLKTLTTSSFASNYACNIPKLQVPNFLSKFPAALLTKFEIRKKPALCIISYVDTNVVDFMNSEFYKALFDIPVFSNLQVNANGNSRLFELCREAHCKAPNLYT